MLVELLKHYFQHCCKFLAFFQREVYRMLLLLEIMLPEHLALFHHHRVQKVPKTNHYWLLIQQPNLDIDLNIFVQVVKHPHLGF